MKQYVKVYDNDTASILEDLINEEISKGSAIEGIYTTSAGAGTSSYSRIIYRTIVVYSTNEIHNILNNEK